MGYLICDSCEGSLNPQRGHDPQIEDHCLIPAQEVRGRRTTRFKYSLVFIVSSRLVRTTHSERLSQETNKQILEENLKDVNFMLLY